MPSDASGRVEALEHMLAERESELLQAQAVLSPTRGHSAAPEATVAERARTIANLTASLKEQARKLAGQDAPVAGRLGKTVHRTRSGAVEAIRLLGRRYVSPQTCNRLVRRHPWLRRAQVRVMAPLPASSTAPGQTTTAPELPAAISQAAPTAHSSCPCSDGRCACNSRNDVHTGGTPYSLCPSCHMLLASAPPLV